MGSYCYEPGNKPGVKGLTLPTVAIFSTSFVQGPRSKPKRVFSGSVATIKALIGSQIFRCKVKATPCDCNSPGLFGKMAQRCSLWTKSKTFCLSWLTTAFVGHFDRAVHNVRSLLGDPLAGAGAQVERNKVVFIILSCFAALTPPSVAWYQSQ